MCNEYLSMCCTYLKQQSKNPNKAIPGDSGLVPVRFSFAKTLCRTRRSQCESLSLPEECLVLNIPQLMGCKGGRNHFTDAETLFQTSPWAWHFVLKSYTTKTPRL